MRLTDEADQEKQQQQQQQQEKDTVTATREHLEVQQNVQNAGDCTIGEAANQENGQKDQGSAGEGPRISEQQQPYKKARLREPSPDPPPPPPRKRS